MSKRIKLDLFFCATLIAEDAEYTKRTFNNYVDLETGKIDIVYDNDNEAEAIAGVSIAENQEKKLLYSSDHKRFLKLPELTHIEQHQILQDFLYSDWTDNKELRDKALWHYNSSIGGWLKGLSHDIDILDAWYEYKQNYIETYTKLFFRNAINELEIPIVEENGEFYISIHD